MYLFYVFKLLITYNNSVPLGSIPTYNWVARPILIPRAIIVGIIIGIVLISLLLALFFLRRWNNRRPQAVPSSNPSATFLPQNYTSNGQSPLSQSMSSKFSHRNPPSDPATAASKSSRSGMPPSTRLRPQFSSPLAAFVCPTESSESHRLPLTGSQTTSNIDGARPGVPQATEPSIQRSPSPQRDNARFVWHEDSGVRISSAEDNVVEFPPLYTPG